MRHTRWELECGYCDNKSKRDQNHSKVINQLDGKKILRRLNRCKEVLTKTVPTETYTDVYPNSYASPAITTHEIRKIAHYCDEDANRRIGGLISFVGDIGPMMLPARPEFMLVEVIVLEESIVSVRESRPLSPRGFTTIDGCVGIVACAAAPSAAERGVDEMNC